MSLTNFFAANELQASDNELSKMTSLSSIQTKGLKRQFAEDEWLAKMTEAGTEIEKVVVNDSEGKRGKKNTIKLYATFKRLLRCYLCE